LTSDLFNHAGASAPNTTRFVGITPPGAKTVTGAVDVRQAGAALRVKASFPVLLSDYNIPKPRYLGVGVKDTVQVEVIFAVLR
jgi:hypothetical protein